MKAASLLTRYVERRESFRARIPSDLTMTCDLVLLGEREFSVRNQRVANISYGGMAVELSPFIRPGVGSRVRVTVSDERGGFSLSGSIRHARKRFPKGLIGIKFDRDDDYRKYSVELTRCVDFYKELANKFRPHDRKIDDTPEGAKANLAAVLFRLASPSRWLRYLGSITSAIAESIGASERVRSRFAALVLALLSIGIITGPGYLTHHWLFRNRLIGQYPIVEGRVEETRLGTAEKPGPVSTRAFSSKWRTPVVLRLAPDMNPISFELVGKAVQMRERMARTSYTLTLTMNGEKVWQQEVEPQEKEKGPAGRNKNEASLTPGPYDFEIQTQPFFLRRSGEYLLEMSPSSQAPSLLIDLDLHVRAKTAQAKRWVYVPGLGLFLASLPVLLLIVRASEHSKRHDASGLRAVAPTI